MIEDEELLMMKAMGDAHDIREEFGRLEEIKAIRSFRKAERKRYEYLKSKFPQLTK